MAGLFNMVTRKQEQRDMLLSAYLDGQLSAGERARLEAQLAADPALRAEFEALRRTVTLVRNLPAVPVPRNFILPHRMATRPRLARLVRPRHAWAAPLLTAATAVVSLLCVAVLVGDLLLSGMGGRAFVPMGAPAAAPMEAPQVALAPTQAAEEVAVEVEVTVEVEKVVSATAAPALPTEVPPREVEPAATTEAEAYTAETPAGVEATAAPAAPAPTPSPLPMLAAAPTASPPPPAAAEAVPSPTASATATTLQQQDMGGATPTPGEVAEVAPPPVEEEQPGAAEGGQGAAPSAPAAISPWRILEAILGLATVGLMLATIRAWRARRR